METALSNEPRKEFARMCVRACNLDLYSFVQSNWIPRNARNFTLLFFLLIIFVNERSDIDRPLQRRESQRIIFYTSRDLFYR